jgi:hypothetical protein
MTDCYHILKDDNTIEPGDEFYNPETGNWEPAEGDLLGVNHCAAHEYPVRRKIDTKDVDPAQAGDLWDSLYATLRIFVGLVEQLDINVEETQVTVTERKSNISASVSLCDVFEKSIQHLRDACPSYAAAIDEEEEEDEANV